MASKLLLYSSDSHDFTFCEALAKNAKLEILQVSQLDEILQAIRDTSVRLFFFGFQDRSEFLKFESRVQEGIGLLSNLVQTNRYFYFGDTPLHKTGHLLRSPLFGGYILRAGDLATISGERFGLMCPGLMQERAFGLESLMPGSKIQKVTLSRASQKQEAVEAVKKFVLAAKFSARMSNSIANAVDELLMNAMYDAPVDAFGKHLYTNTLRTKELDLSGQAEVQMQLAFDRNTVAVSAIDLFGSLDKTKLLAHISKEYSKEEYKIRSGTAGAGIGLANVFQLGGSFCFASEQSAKTQVTVFFTRTETFREFKNQFRFLVTQFYLSGS